MGESKHYCGGERITLHTDMPVKPPIRDLTNVKCVRRSKDKNGEEKIELLVLFDWESPDCNLNEDIINDMKELFMMFDTDQDGVISLGQIKSVFKCLGKRLTDEAIEDKVRLYTEDDKNLSLEFNEFLGLISGEMEQDPTEDKYQLLQAFRMFDKDEDGKLSTQQLRQIMVTVGEHSIKEAEFNQFLQLVEPDEDGLVDYTLLCQVLSTPRPALSTGTQSVHRHAE